MTDAIKSKQITIRLTAEQDRLLKQYCVRNAMNPQQAVPRALARIIDGFSGATPKDEEVTDAAQIYNAAIEAAARACAGCAPDGPATTALERAEADTARLCGLAVRALKIAPGTAPPQPERLA